MSLGVDVDRTRFVQADASHNLLRTLSPNGKRSGKATGQLCPASCFWPHLPQSNQASHVEWV